MRAAVLGRLDPRRANRAFIVLGDKDAAAAQIVERVTPLLFPRLALLGERVRHLGLELGPELAQRRLIGFRGAPDRHPAAPGRAAASR